MFKTLLKKTGITRQFLRKHFSPLLKLSEIFLFSTLSSTPYTACLSRFPDTFQRFNDPYCYCCYFYYLLHYITEKRSQKQQSQVVHSLIIRSYLKEYFMKIIFDKVKLLAALTPAMGCVSSKNTFTSLEGVLIEASEDGRCRVMTYDMDKGVRANVAAQVIEPGSYIVNAQDFYQYVRVMPENEIELSVNEKMTAHLRCNRVCYTMRALNGKEFPTPPELDGEWGFVIEQSILKTIMGSTAHSIAQTDSNHPELCGGYLQIRENLLTMVACNTFTLSKCEYYTKINADLPSEINMIIPGKYLNELQKILSDDEEDLMTIKPAKKHVVFVIGDLIFFSRLIDMKYLDYERIIQGDMPITVKINRVAFLECLERAALISEKKSVSSTRSHLRLHFSDNLLKISSTSLSGQINDELPCEYSGEELEIGFTCRFLIDVLRALDCDNVTMKLKGPRTSMYVMPTEKDEKKKQFFLVMPVKLSD